MLNVLKKKLSLVSVRRQSLTLQAQMFLSNNGTFSKQRFVTAFNLRRKIENVIDEIHHIDTEWIKFLSNINDEDERIIMEEKYVKFAIATKNETKMPYIIQRYQLEDVAADIETEEMMIEVNCKGLFHPFERQKTRFFKKSKIENDLETSFFLKAELNQVHDMANDNVNNCVEFLPVSEDKIDTAPAADEDEIVNISKKLHFLQKVDKAVETDPKNVQRKIIKQENFLNNPKTFGKKYCFLYFGHHVKAFFESDNVWRIDDASDKSFWDNFANPKSLIQVLAAEFQPIKETKICKVHKVFDRGKN